ncbi:MAG TPA: AMP-binding protein, partial [Pyrinomonadaceae bacterium]|nr:AMP-binding protein [Pyrinomonadaceae bacterium]
MSDRTESGARDEFSSLVELLRLRAAEGRGRASYIFLADGGAEEARLTHAELDLKARAVGAWLQAREARGERALLLYPAGLEFVAAFFGCLYAGTVAVPVYPPRRNRSLLRLQSIIADAQATFALTTAAILEKLAPVLAATPELAAVRWLTTDDLPDALADEWRAPAEIDERTLAFLQYTSGSTAAPKGVMVTHGNLLSNERMIRRACEHTEDSTFVGWLPLYHDMGLIGNVLHPLYLNSACVLMSPVTFLQKPLNWLEAITRYRAATSGGPNFAYDLCVRRITPEQREGLDLSSWTTAFNGAEPVRHATLERFARTFEPHGFRRQALYPCYGLAEATLFVSGGTRASEPATLRVKTAALERHRVEPCDDVEADETSRILVSSGHAAEGQRIVVVEPETCVPCVEGRVGEIWVSGASVAQGYWNRPEETERAFGARLDGADGETFLRTGDLGFQLGGELFVTGRLKDLIIVRGRNHYPQDIELTVERSHSSLRPGCGAAFSVEAGGEERLVVVQEVDRQRPSPPDEIFARVRQAVAEEHELQPYAVCLIKTGSIPKTSSGKIQRQSCRAAFLDGALDALAIWRAGSDGEAAPPEVAFGEQSSDAEVGVEARLASLVARVLKVERASIDLERPLSHFGLDSLQAIELAHEVETGLGVSLPMASFLGDQSIAQLAATLALAGESVPTRPTRAVVAESESVPGQPLSYGQSGLWFLHQMSPESAAYNIGGPLGIRHPVEVGALRRALELLAQRHDALRTVFISTPEGARQIVREESVSDFRQEDASGWDADQLSGRLVEEHHQPFDLENGPLLRVRLFTRAAADHVLQLTAHHIIADLWSLGVLLSELGQL